MRLGLFSVYFISISYFQTTGKGRVLVDVWAEPHLKRNYAHVLVAPEFVKDFKKLLESEGFDNYRIIKKDIQK